MFSCLVCTYRARERFGKILTTSLLPDPAPPQTSQTLSLDFPTRTQCYGEIGYRVTREFQGKESKIHQKWPFEIPAEVKAIRARPCLYIHRILILVL